MADIGSIQVIVTLTNGKTGAGSMSGPAVDAMRRLLVKVDTPVTTRSVATAVESAMIACDPEIMEAERRRREGK